MSHEVWGETAGLERSKLVPLRGHFVTDTGGPAKEEVSVVEFAPNTVSEFGMCTEFDYVGEPWDRKREPWKDGYMGLIT